MERCQECRAGKSSSRTDIPQPDPHSLPTCGIDSASAVAGCLGSMFSLSYCLSKTDCRRGGMAVATVSAKGQIVLPKEVREALGLRRGDRLSLECDGESVVLTRLPVAPKGDWRGWRGALAGRRALQEHLEEHAEEANRRRGRWFAKGTLVLDCITLTILNSGDAIPIPVRRLQGSFPSREVRNTSTRVGRGGLCVDSPHRPRTPAHLQGPVTVGCTGRARRRSLRPRSRRI